jgi:preprotein translocase subunit SecD
MAIVAQAGKFTVPLTDTDYLKLSSSNQQLITAALADFNCDAGPNETDTATSYFLACDSFGYAHLLGPVVVAGKQISTAAAQAPNANGGSSVWSVALTLKGSGLTKWANYTHAHNISSSSPSQSNSTANCGSTGYACADYVAFTLDGRVISAPVTESTINTPQTSITGGFTPSTATTLANQLKYGALPLSFRADSAQSISATLGSTQLKAGLLAGGIGLVLVVIYTLIYYRALGLVTISSLLVSGVLTYGCLVMLATQIDFTLSLAGIAGFIVAVGITADSFVVFFERIKDEVHDGRSARVAIPRAWVRARRTILSADTVSFLAAAILYYFAAGDVKGFAFTLGLSTILDLVVVFLFTHPLVSYLSKFRAFGSRRFTGLDAVRGGPAISEVQLPSPVRAKRAVGTPVQRAPSAVAVLERADEEPGHGEPEQQARVEAELTTGAERNEPTERDEADQADEAEDAEDAERRHVEPEHGSAAERAAARQARLREERRKKKEGR